jgi:5'-nucleotidase/UDP-sugar diphosphatase
VVLHTNDLHGHLEGHEPEVDYSPLTLNDDQTRGGFARIAAQVKAERSTALAAGSDLLLLDSGDFMMGTAFSSFLGVFKATELTEMTRMGYDAITLGNHEFDFTSKGTAAFIQAAVTGGSTPPLVASNLLTDGGAVELAAVQAAGLLPQERVITSGTSGLKVGIIGLMGKNAASVAPLAAPATFAGQAATAATLVDDLRNQKHVDVVIVLSHSGISPAGTGEDAALARNVPGIDIIISGHTHDALPQPVKVGSTFIVQTGAYGLNLGKGNFTFTPGVGVTLDSYALVPIDDSIAGDATVQARVDGYVADLDHVLTDAGLPAYLTPLAHTAFDLPIPPFQETSLGDLVTDAYLTAANSIPGAPTSDVAIESSGNIRVPVLAGKTGALTFADLFNVVPLGVGFDDKPGYPLVAIYLNGQDLKRGLEIVASARDILGANNDYFFQLSGMHFAYQATGAPLGRVISATIGGQAVNFTDTTRCYRVVTTYYVASLLPIAGKINPMLTVTPKLPDCATAYDSTAGHPLRDAILDRDPATAGVQELKNWGAFVRFVAAQPPVSGVPELSMSYQSPQGRITVQ